MGVISPATPATRRFAGTAVDYSLQKPDLSGLNLLQTVLPSTSRTDWSVQNQSAGDITVALDDGSNNGLTVYVLNSADDLGRQGGAINSGAIGPHLGRIRVYGLAGSRVAIRA